MNPFFDWLKASGTQEMLVLVGTLAAIVGAVAAVFAAIYGNAAPTKKDLARVEQNTAHLEDVRTGIIRINARMDKQDQKEQLQNRANRVSIRANGNQSGNIPFSVELYLRNAREANLSLTHVELYNEHGNSFGSFPCVRTDNPSSLDFRADVPMASMGTWFYAGTPDQGLGRMRLKLSIGMSIDGVDVSREMAVIIRQTGMGGGMPGFSLEGNI